MNTSIVSNNRQRGVYSEIINPENSLAMGVWLTLTQNNALTGPDSSLLIITQQRQHVPKATGLKLRKTPEVILERKASKQNAERIIKALNEP